MMKWLFHTELWGRKWALHRDGRKHRSCERGEDQKTRESGDSHDSLLETHIQQGVVSVDQVCGQISSRPLLSLLLQHAWLPGWSARKRVAYHTGSHTTTIVLLTKLQLPTYLLRAQCWRLSTVFSITWICLKRLRPSTPIFFVPLPSSSNRSTGRRPSRFWSLQSLAALRLSPHPLVGKLPTQAY